MQIWIIRNDLDVRVQMFELSKPSTVEVNACTLVMIRSNKAILFEVLFFLWHLIVIVVFGRRFRPYSFVFSISRVSIGGTLLAALRASHYCLLDTLLYLSVMFVFVFVDLSQHSRVCSSHTRTREREREKRFDH